jgi:hypothetical protein
LLKAKPARLAAALKPGGMLPELRGERLKELAMRVKDDFGGDLRAALAGPIAQARKKLKSFHSIADPGADRILLFAGISAIAAVPSNCVHVLDRILHPEETQKLLGRLSRSPTCPCRRIARRIRCPHSRLPAAENTRAGNL